MNKIIPFLIALADDELVLGHRDSEWTGYAPILEEDIAFSNIAQDELGHSLAFYTLAESLNGKSPDVMAFERPWQEFTCCRFVSYPKGDFAYTVVRQFLFDAAEQIRMKSLGQSSFAPLHDLSSKILAEEAYHLMHSRALVERLGLGTEESHQRMQSALDTAFPQAVGMFEPFDGENDLVNDGVIKPSAGLRDEWIAMTVPVLQSASLAAPVQNHNGRIVIQCKPDDGGRRKIQTEHMRQLVADLQQVYQTAPGGRW